MSKESKTPAIRFKGYSEAWEQRRLGDVVEKYEDPVETPLNGYNRLGLRSHAKGVFHSYVEKGKELSTGQLHRVAAGNLIVNITFAWEHAVAITSEDDKDFLVSQRFPQFSFHNGNSPVFFSFVIAQESFRHHLWLASPGGAGRNRVLNQNEMLEYELRLPSYQEQLRVGLLLKEFDSLITLHQRKLDKLKNVKKALLEKMFPQKDENIPLIRFKGYSEAWEQRRLGEFCSSFQYGLNAPATQYDGIHKYLRITDIDDDSHSFITKSITSPAVDCEASQEYLMHEGEIVFARTGASVGKTYLYKEIDGQVYFAGFLIRARIKSDCSAEFIFQNTLTNSYNKFVSITSQRSGQPGINAQEYGDWKLSVPEIQEQIKIGIFLSEIDTLITLHQRKLDKLKNVKKALLEKMFV